MIQKSLLESINCPSAYTFPNANALRRFLEEDLGESEQWYAMYDGQPVGSCAVHGPSGIVITDGGVLPGVSKLVIVVRTDDLEECA